MKPWTIKQLHQEITADMNLCHSDSERATCRAICGKEIRETAEKMAATRKLTPGEIAIAEQFGYRA
jgi:hypothetical protein